MEETKRLFPLVQGKIIQQDYDFITSLEGECSYCLTDAQVQMILATVDYLGWTTRWYSETGLIDKSVILDLKNGLVERLMNGCCGEGDLYQWSVTGVLQISVDNGTTWTDAPQLDPRNNSPTFPPTPGEVSDDKRCIAATGMAMLIKEQVGDQLTDDMSRYTLAQLIQDWTETVLSSGGNIFSGLVTVIANQIFALVIAALRPALTSEVYELLTCAFYNNMADDLSFTDEQWGGVRSEIASNISGVAGVFLEHLVFLLGKVGITNLARSQAATEGVCTDCETCDDEWIQFELELAIEDYGAIIRNVGGTDYGHWVAGTGFVSDDAGGNQVLAINIDLTPFAPGRVRHLRLYGTVGSNVTNGFGGDWGAFTHNDAADLNDTDSYGEFYQWTGEQDYYQDFFYQSYQNVAPGAITYTRISGEYNCSPV